METPDPEDGFALIDAVTALMIFALTVSFALSAAATARRLATATLETRQSASVLAYLIDKPLPLGVSHGDGWSVDIAPLVQNGELGIRLCRRTASIHLAGRRKVRSASSLQPCPQEGLNAAS